MKSVGICFLIILQNMQSFISLLLPFLVWLRVLIVFLGMLRFQRILFFFVNPMVVLVLQIVGMLLFLLQMLLRR